MMGLWYNKENNKATARRQSPVAWPSLLGRFSMDILPHASGIYKITCTTTNKVYVGSTTKIRKRWGWHRNDLRRGVHHNRHLQFAWNKYGEQCFEFEILEMVMFAEHLHDREQHWLDHYQAYDSDKGFNHGKVARAPWLGRLHSDETKQKLSDSAKAHDTIANARAFADEWHGSGAGLAWHREHGKRTWDERVAVTKICAYCSSTYQTLDTRSATRFCSNNCKAQARRVSRVDNEDRICLWCQKTFSTSKYLGAKCCSLSCAAYYRHKKATP